MKYLSLFLCAALAISPCLLGSTAAQDGKAPAAKADEKPTIDPKVVEKFAKAFGEWIAVKDTGDLKALRKLKKVRATLDKEKEKVKAAGIDLLENTAFWRAVLTSPKFTKFGPRFSGNKKWKLGRRKFINFAVSCPGSYRPDTPSATVLCLHPLDDGTRFKGQDYLRSMYADKALSDLVIQFAPDAPKTAGFHWSDRSSLVYTLGVLGQQIRGDDGLHFNTDHNGLFLDGYDSGGTDAWKLASGFADLFAGVIIRGALPPAETRFEDFKNTPVLLYGLAGREMDPAKADEVAAKMKAAGVDVTVVKIDDFKLRKEKAAFKTTPPEVLAFFGKRRAPYPLKIDWSVKETHTRRAYYIKSKNEVEDETLPQKKRGVAPNFQVSVDKAKNRITITSHRIEGFLLNLNEELVDLEKPVTVEVNTKVVFNGKLEPNWKELVDNWEIYGENTAIFPVTLLVEVPPAEEEPEKKAEPETAKSDKGGEKPKPK